MHNELTIKYCNHTTHTHTHHTHAHTHPPVADEDREGGGGARAAHATSRRVGARNDLWLPLLSLVHPVWTRIWA